MIRKVEQALAGRAARPHPRREHRAAAVLVPIFERDDALHTLFIVRQAHLASHPGQIAFPGGGIDPEDASPEAAALREMQEELGVAPEQVTVLGALDEIETVTGYRVTPVVGAIPYPVRLRPDPYEVADYFTLPLARLRDPAIFREEDWTSQGRDYPVYFYEVEGRVIWGATAKILRLFLHRVYGDPAPKSLSEMD